MKITKHVPEPVYTPPTTYDITGLTRQEFEHIRSGLGNLTSREFDQTTALLSSNLVQVFSRGVTDRLVTDMNVVLRGE